MQNIKALDFLRSIKEDTPCEWNELDEAISELETFHSRHEKEKEDFGILLGDQHRKISELITELEELKKPKTCEYCRFFHLRIDGFNYCDRHSLMNGIVYSDFGCIHFEPKETE